MIELEHSNELFHVEVSGPFDGSNSTKIMKLENPDHCVAQLQLIALSTYESMIMTCINHLRKENKTKFLLASIVTTIEAVQWAQLKDF
jgi:hypothetical protein